MAVENVSVMDSIKAAFSKETAEPGEASEKTGAEGAATIEDTDTYDAPTDWAHEDRETFRAYTPEVRKWTLNRFKTVEDGWKTKSADLEKFQGTYKPVHEFFESRKNSLPQGYTALQATQQLFDLNERAARDPDGFVKWFMQSRGLDPAKVFALQQQAADADAGGWVDPEVQALKQELAQVRQGLQQTAQQFQARQHAEQQHVTNGWLKQIDDFRNATAPDNKTPKHPYLKEVEGHMAALLKGGHAKDLADAYDQATYASPTVRAKVLADAKAAERLAQQKTEREHAAKAQKAGATVTSSGARSESTSTSQTKKGESVRDSIRRAQADLTKESA